jgi:hypothetical protein
MCYCSTPESQIVSDINRVAVPANGLTEAHCWKTICRVRGKNFVRINPESWSELCSERGYLLRRQNPRGL